MAEVEAHTPPGATQDSTHGAENDAQPEEKEHTPATTHAHHKADDRTPAPTQTDVDTRTHEEIYKLALAGREEWVTPRREYRARAHSNPLNDGAYPPPASPSAWAGQTPPPFADGKGALWLDIGCGYGGLLGSLSVAYPGTNMLGMEIRDKVALYCQHRAAALKRGNLYFVRTNAMKFLPYYCGRQTLRRMFFCYPDPHFKRRKHRQRVINTHLLAEYAYVLADGAVVHTVTDVRELHDWMCEAFAECPLFVRRTEEVETKDPVTRIVRDYTDEAHKVHKAGGDKFAASYTRIPNDAIE